MPSRCRACALTTRSRGRADLLLLLGEHRGRCECTTWFSICTGVLAHCCVSAKASSCRLTRRSTRTSRTRGLRPRAGRRLACFVRAQRMASMNVVPPDPDHAPTSRGHPLTPRERRLLAAMGALTMGLLVVSWLVVEPPWGCVVAVVVGLVVTYVAAKSRKQRNWSSLPVLWFRGRE